MRLVQVVALAALVTAVAALAGVGRPGPARGSSASSSARSSAAPGRVITVNGTGMAKAVPNQASFTFGVQAEASTAQAAQAVAAARMAHVISAMRARGIAKTDLQTADVSVGPQWSSSGTISGYSAHSSLNVKVRGVARAGRIVDAAVAAGATETSGPTFSRADRAALYSSALRNAFTQARAKARTLAVQAGVHLAGVVRVEEQAPEPQPYPGIYATALDKASTPVEPGTQETKATVSVTFALA
jgi:uncharacterized protein YggE